MFITAIGDKFRAISASRLLLLTLGVSLLLTLTVEVVYAQKYRAQVQVSAKEGVGVNPTTENLDFGDMAGGTRQTRFLALENEDGRSAYVLVWVLGDISELAEIDDSSFVLEGGESKRVTLLVSVPESAPKRTFDGTVFVFRLPWFWS